MAMRKEMQQCLEQGMSRRDIFLRFQGQGINDMRLAKQVATLVTRRRQDECFLLNWLLVIAVVCLTLFVAGTLEFRVAVYMPILANGAVLVVVLLSVAQIIGFLRFHFDAYVSCTLVSGLLTVIFAMVLWLWPVIAAVGVLVAVINLLLSLHTQRELFPRMGFLDIRKTPGGAFMLD